MIELGAGFLDEGEAVVRQADLVGDVVQGAHGVLEGHLGRFESGHPVQGGVGVGDGLAERAADFVGGQFELGQHDDRIEFGGALSKLLQGIHRTQRFNGAASHGQAGEQKKPQCHFANHRHAD